MRLCTLGHCVPGCCTCPRAPMLGAGCPPHGWDPWAAPPGHSSAGEGRAVPGAWARPCWANVAALRLGAGLGLAPPSPGPTLPRRTLPGSVPSRLGESLGLPSLRPSLGPGDSGGTLEMLLAQRWGLGHGSSIRPASRAQLPCHLPARGDPSPAMEGRLEKPSPWAFPITSQPRGPFRAPQQPTPW